MEVVRGRYVEFGDHARRRMRSRRILLEAVMQTLQAPEIEHLALFQSEFGEHRRIAERGFEDGRIRVVFEMSTRDIFVVTCMWVVLDN